MAVEVGVSGKNPYQHLNINWASSLPLFEVEVVLLRSKRTNRTLRELSVALHHSPIVLCVIFGEASP